MSNAGHISQDHVRVNARPDLEVVIHGAHCTVAGELTQSSVNDRVELEIGRLTVPLLVYSISTLLMHVDAPAAAVEVCYNPIGCNEHKNLMI